MQTQFTTSHAHGTGDDVPKPEGRATGTGRRADHAEGLACPQALCPQANENGRRLSPDATPSLHTKRSTSHFRHGSWLVCALLLVLLLSTACGRSASQSSAADQAAIRDPKPTFTPTPAEPVVQAAPVMAQPAVAATPTPAAPVPTGAKVIISDPLVNVRTGPGLDYEVVTIVERGQEFDILSRDPLGEWWQVCCVDDEPIWVIDSLVETQGPIDAVPTFGREPVAAPALPAPALAEPAAAEDATFELRDQEQFAETELVRIFMYVYAGTETLPNYTLRVRYNGTDLPVETLSFGGQAGFTWPFQDPRQRSQNWKAEFPNIGPAGTWEVQIMDAQGRLVGPPATFTLAQDDPNQELYVRYERQ